MNEMEKALLKFLQGLDALEKEHGSPAVEDALKKLLPDFSPDNLDGVEVMSEGVLLEYAWLLNMARAAGPRILGAAAATGRSAQKFVKYLWKKAKGAPAGGAGKAAEKSSAGGKVIDIGTGFAGGAAAGAAGGAAATGAAAAAGGALSGVFSGDTDVNIDDISTDKALNIKSKELEKILKSTNKAVKDLNNIMRQTAKMLGTSFDSLETSVDDMVSAQTGESAAQVNARQGAGAKAPRRSRRKQSPDQKSPLEKRADLFPGAEV